MRELAKEMGRWGKMGHGQKQANQAERKGRKKKN